MAFLAAMVGPKVAAASAQRALEVLAEEDPAVAAEAAALQQDAAQNGQGPADGGAAPGLHTQHTTLVNMHATLVVLSYWMLQAVVVTGPNGIMINSPGWEPELPNAMKAQPNVESNISPLVNIAA